MQCHMSKSLTLNTIPVYTSSHWVTVFPLEEIDTVFYINTICREIHHKGELEK